MTQCFPHPAITPIPVQRGKGNPVIGGVSVGAFRLPTDPLFFATLELQNIVVGSRYRVVQDSDGALLAEGDATGASETLVGLPAYSNPMLVRVTVRKGTSAPKYKPGEFYGYLAKAGGSVYIAQVSDTIA